MRTKTSLALAAIVAAGVSAGCGGSSSSNPRPSTSRPPGYYITIFGMAFSPVNLDVPPGATVTVVNQDGISHSVTSEDRAGAFVPGGVAGVSFDTGLFTTEKSFTLPANAPEGTVVPYYCRVHTSTMATPTGTVTVKTGAPAGPGPAAPGGGGSGGGGGMY
ncbi:plastocyanin/azurin family copper-binding protein [Anaeromyxobacter oryzae]|uniref:Blue (type 1) copper domain-containing protein n=1 Tax=Anaeromyxobacter oryzae TaxID=2918170 RepID=A0ABM7WUL1_9BACT|nr:plastocyanin/azurin family copper-binding protein [Anaeromyxobacter oryzae]BDG03186.1 hypothetical protein AMOR_21820 [Anaeromyxobacter oryzae]